MRLRIWPWSTISDLRKENAQLKAQVKGVPVLLEFIKRRHRLDVDLQRSPDLTFLKPTKQRL